MNLFASFQTLHRSVSLGICITLHCFSNSVYAQEIDIGIAAQYSGFIFGNTSNIHHVDGRLAVGGNLTMGGFNIGNKVSDNSNQPSLVVGGDLTTTGGGQIQAGPGHSGLVSYSGSFTPHPSAPFESLKEEISPIDFEAERTYLTMLSKDLRDMPATGTVVQSNSKIVLTGSNQDTEVFYLKPEHVKNGLNLTLANVKPNSHLILNIASDDQRKVNIGVGMNALKNRKSRVLLNLYDADVASFNSGVIHGSVLAPWACIRDGNGQLDGTIIAASWSSNMKMGSGAFEASQ